MTDALERIYLGMLVIAPLAFVGVAAVYAYLGMVVQGIGFLAIALVVGALSLYFYRGGG